MIPTDAPPHSRNPFIVGFLAFACPSLLSIVILLGGGPPYSADSDSSFVLLALVIVLAYGPANTVLSLVWPLYSSLATWGLLAIIGWIASGTLFGTVFSFFRRVLGPAWGYPVALLCLSLVLLLLVYVTSAFLTFG